MSTTPNTMPSRAAFPGIGEIMKYGWKFLDPTGSTYQGENQFKYVLPRPDEKLSEPTFAPNPITEDDGAVCGAGRLHLMRRPTNPHGPRNWWPWYAKAEGVVTAGDSDKFGATSVRLRMVRPKVWHRIIRLGWCKGAYLRNADLKGANLTSANLSGADLRWANLKGANLMGASLIGATLRDANLVGADLRGVNLIAADLTSADLTGADLRGAYLYEANIINANLRNADLYGANLLKADLRGANLAGADLSGANLSGADLTEANLQWANLTDANLDGAAARN
jgi:hypothetical protein